MKLDDIKTNRLILMPVTLEITRELLNGKTKEIEKIGLKTLGRWPGPDTFHILPIVNKELERYKYPTGFEFWMVIIKETMTIIGDIGFHGQPDDNGEVEIGYGLIEQERSKGYAFEALQAMVSWAAKQRGVKSVIADCLIENKASSHILEKVGMKEIKRDKKLIYWKLAINKKIRMATEFDSASILEIYAPFISDSIITFEGKLPTDAEFRKRITDVIKKYPWLVYEVNGKIIGYAYASQYNNRCAYDWSVDYSIYINPDFHRKGIATALYNTLTQLLKLQGYYNAYVGIALPNTKSESFHQAFGFKPIGVYHNVGYKLNGWHDVMGLEYTIVEHSMRPLKPKMINEIKDSIEFNKIINRV